MSSNDAEAAKAGGPPKEEPSAAELAAAAEAHKRLLAERQKKAEDNIHLKEEVSNLAAELEALRKKKAELQG